MSLVVVRCPACESASRVAADALGQMVGCPGCQSPFVAVEDAPAQPLPSRAGSPRPVRARPVRQAPRPAAVIPIAPPRWLEPSREESKEMVGPNQPSESAPVLATIIPDPEHDPHSPPVGGLPVSVLVGFALMPFGIPLLWFVGPIVSGTEAALSLAVPISLAIAAAALCLGVVYTIDWTAATRIKGVLILVGLAYLTAAGLYFLKKDLMDQVRGFFGPSKEWRWVQPRDESWKIMMPRRAWAEEQQPLPGLAQMPTVWRARCASDAQNVQVYEYRFAASKSASSARKTEPVWLACVREAAWFVCVDEQLKQSKGRDEELVGERPVEYPHSPRASGRQWTFKSGTSGTVRIVQVFVIESRAYYLSAEGPELTEDAELAKNFFDSFEATPRK